MKKLRNAAYVLALALAFAVALFFSLPEAKLSPDDKCNGLLCGALARAALTLFLVLLFFFRGQGGLLRFPVKTLPRDLLFLILPLLVAAVNFPYSALASGAATVDVGYLPPFLFLCVTIGAAEELLFRGILHTAFRDALKKKRHGRILAVLLSAAVFGLWHLVNLFYGAGIGPTLLQVGYTFLLGAMFAVVFDRTKNIWLCVLVHALFDVGGTIVEHIGTGSPHDLIFWILTAAIGTLCAAQMIFSAVRADRAEREFKETP